METTLKTRIEAFLAQLEADGLNRMGLTGDGNGYPEPDLGYFVWGFDTIGAAHTWAEQWLSAYDSPQVVQATWKNGWGYATYKGEWSSTTEAIDIVAASDQESDNQHVIGSQDELDQYLSDERKMFAENHEPDSEVVMVGVEPLSEAEIADGPDLAYITDVVGADIDWNTQILVVDSCDLWAEVRDRQAMHYTYDTKHEAIGVHISLDWLNADPIGEALDDVIGWVLDGDDDLEGEEVIGKYTYVGYTHVGETYAKHLKDLGYVDTEDTPEGMMIALTKAGFMYNIDALKLEEEEEEEEESKFNQHYSIPTWCTLDQALQHEQLREEDEVAGLKALTDADAEVVEYASLGEGMEPIGTHCNQGKCRLVFKANVFAWIDYAENELV